jgi:hypothetical protein
MGSTPYPGGHAAGLPFGLRPPGGLIGFSEWGRWTVHCSSSVPRRLKETIGVGAVEATFSAVFDGVHAQMFRLAPA